MLKGKAWGTTTVLEKTPLFEMHRMSIAPMKRCSWHRHERKWNAFVCLMGVLYVQVRPRAYDLTDVIMLLPGQTATVPPGEMHRFYTMESYTEALEMYYPDTLSDDIVREDTGGSTA